MGAKRIGAELAPEGSRPPKDRAVLSSPLLLGSRVEGAPRREGSCVLSPHQTTGIHFQGLSLASGGSRAGRQRQQKLSLHLRF